MTLRREYKLGKWMFNYLKLKGNGKAVNYWTVGIGIGREDSIGSGDWGFTNVMFQDLQRMFTLPLNSD